MYVYATEIYLIKNQYIFLVGIRWAYLIELDKWSKVISGWVAGSDQVEGGQCHRQVRLDCYRGWHRTHKCI